MKKKIYAILILFIVVIAGFIYFTNISSTKKTNITPVFNNKINKVNNEKQKKQVKQYNPANTKIIEEDFEISGISMQPMIKPGAKVKVKRNYYNGGQNQVKSGDIIIWENPFTLERIIKKVSLVPGDKVTFDKKDGSLILNGKLLKNSAGVVYRFDENEIKLINIYVENSVIILGVYFIFGDNTLSSIDSRDFGPITIEGILGKVEM